MNNQRVFAFIIGAGMLLMALGFGAGAALGAGVTEQAVGGLLAIGFVTVVGGVIVWLVVEKPVTDPYKEPAPDYEHDHAGGEH
jgi:hypothetical protein